MPDSETTLLANTLLPRSEFMQRRSDFAAQMPNNSLAIFSAAQEITRSNDTEFPFCQNKTFYYLTGFNEPDGYLIIQKPADSVATTTLFCREKDALMEIWHGRRIGAEQAKLDYGFDESYPLSELDDIAVAYINNTEQLWSCRAQNKVQNAELETNITRWLNQSQSKERQGVSTPKIHFDCSAIVNEMRLIKSAAELSIMRQVNLISGAAHQRAMEKSDVGVYEYQLEAELLHDFARKGARYAAYGTIVAGGNNANILHYTDNQEKLNNNELVLIDAGGELAGYAADITRTFPVNGKFTSEQKALYQLVLDSQEQAIAAIKPKQTLAALNDLVNEVLTTGLVELGLLTGDLASLITDKACKKYFIHGLGHWLGLDVHDVGDYHVENKRQNRLFESGMVMTIEPGLYIPLDDESVDKKWRGIGIRIEDNILVTEDSFENLTVNAPKSVLEIERIMLGNKDVS